MVIIKSAREIELMREAGKIAGDVYKRQQQIPSQIC